MRMIGKQLFPLSLVLLILAAPCPAQSTRVALIDTNAFNDPKNGITRLARAMSIVEQEFEQRSARLSAAQNLLMRLPNETGFFGPIPTDPKPMTPERKKKLKEEATERQLTFELEIKEWRDDYNKRREEVTAPIVEDIRSSLEAFAKARGITMLVDASNLSCPIGCQIESASDINITREFIAEYNRLHP